MINPLHTKYAILRLCVTHADQKLKDMYAAAAEKHNTQLFEETHYNAGFDLITPVAKTVSPNFVTNFLHLGVKAEMKNFEEKYSNDICSYTGYYLYPRSSISKTPLMMANHVGIIDSGYRGEIIAAVRCFQSDQYEIDQHTRLFQICHPSLLPMYVKIVDDEAELSTSTRGEGGFGSTGGMNPAR